MGMKSSFLKLFLSIVIVIVLGLATESFYNNMLVISIMVGLVIGIITRSIKLSLISSVIGVLIWHAIIYLYFQVIPGSTEILNIVSSIVGFPSYFLILIPLIMSVTVTLLASISISLILSR